jgi:hypothetical protein
MSSNNNDNNNNDNDNKDDDLCSVDFVRWFIAFSVECEIWLALEGLDHPQRGVGLALIWVEGQTTSCDWGYQVPVMVAVVYL